MTDNEIIKALECCINTDCVNCPNWSGKWYRGMCNDFLPNVLDLINRQKAEIERLTIDMNAAMTGLQKQLDDKCDRCIARDKAGAIKEFAERLKAKAMLQHGGVTIVYGSDIDNLVKEMEGEDK